jgi:hypothetical protein
VPRGLLVDAAEAAGDFGTVARVAGGLSRDGARRSGHGFFDPWPDRGRHAGASLAAGDERPRASLLERAGRHPEALSLLLRFERRLGHRTLAETEALCAERAPGALAVLSRRSRP